MRQTVAILGALAVVLGAFGAHGLKDQLSDTSIQTYTTGVTYHFYHTLALLALTVWYQFKQDKALVQSFYCFVIGLCLFSGSLYLLATQDLMGVSMKWLGPITPIGGLFFIFGWLNLLRVKA